MSSSTSGIDTWLQIASVVLTTISLLVLCCTPCVTALSNVTMFAGFRILRDRLAYRAPPGAISTESKLVCTFENSKV